MPGIAGLITRLPRPAAEAQLSRMVAALCHEPFYEIGTWIDESFGVYVGWAVRRGSYCAGMPFSNKSSTAVLFFSGEDYHQPDVIRRLKEKGHKFGANASYLVHAYEDEPDFPLRCNGLFHGLVVDRAEGKAILFNDRYGMHRMCVHDGQDTFYFAAEAKAIVAAQPNLREADQKSIGEFIACSCVLGDRTIFKNIKLLPAASKWTFRNKSLENKASYFQPSQWEQQTAKRADDYYSGLREAFSTNLPLYFGGDEPLGMTLTGGLDTRMIMAWHKAAPGSMPCYTFGGELRDCQDVRIARRIAELCGQTHQVITIGSDFLSRFPHYAERSMYIAEGGVDVYRASDLYVSQKAREIASAKVVGTYGSEIVRHAVMFKAVTPPDGLFEPEILSSVFEAQDTYAGLRREHPLTFAAFRQSPWYHQGILNLESSQLTVRSPYLDNDFVRSVYVAPPLNGHNEDVRLRLINDGNPELAKIRTDRGIGINGGLASTLTHGYQEFTFKSEYAYDYGMPQWIAKVDHTVSPLHLERLFLGRHKTSHFRVWYRDQLADYVRQILLDKRTLSRPYLKAGGVDAVVNGHTRNGLNYTSAIHKLLSLELLQRAFFDAR
jgi:asparagine synthase (glutamine-hydrolysing)